MTDDGQGLAMSDADGGATIAFKAGGGLELVMEYLHSTCTSSGLRADLVSALLTLTSPVEYEHWMRCEHVIDPTRRVDLSGCNMHRE